MKTKTESKRQAILKGAAEVFREVGFERASMSDIRARFGAGSGARAELDGRSSPRGSAEGEAPAA